MTLEELKERQRWTLDQKIYHTIEVLDTFVQKMGGVKNTYLSFSGGKDSTVLLDICRKIYPDMEVVFINTGNEWPEVLEFVKEIEQSGVNLVRLHPEMSPKKVWSTVGFPLISKEAAQKIFTIRNNPNGKTSLKWMREDNPFKLAKRWQYLLKEPYDTSHRCCTILKKKPAAKYEKETGKHPIVGIMASESKFRETNYLAMGGCNVFNSKGRSISYPLAIWTDDDIWNYIRKYNLKIAEVYYKGVTRTGCVGCGFGAYRDDKDNPTLNLLYNIHPRYYNTIMNYTNNGITYREALRKLKAVTNNYLPDEQPAQQLDMFEE